MGYSVEVSSGVNLLNNLCSHCFPSYMHAQGWLLLKAGVIKEPIMDGPAKGIRIGAIMLDFLAR